MASWAHIDLEGGSRIHEFFALDGVYDLGAVQYIDRAGIEEAFRLRAARGPRLSRHLLSNVRVEIHDDRHAAVRAHLCLHAADGEPPLPSRPPIAIGDLVDQFVRDADGRWLIQRRTFRAVFVSEEEASPFLSGGLAGSGPTVRG
jgi:hypothetical protein